MPHLIFLIVMISPLTFIMLHISFEDIVTVFGSFIFQNKFVDFWVCISEILKLDIFPLYVGHDLFDLL